LNNQLKNNALSEDLIDVIYTYIVTKGKPPKFAEQYCKYVMDNNIAPQKIIDAVNAVIKKNYVPPVFAAKWYENQQKLQQVQAKSSNWYKFYKVQNV